MNEFLELILPWRETTNDEISDFFVYGILLTFSILLVIFLLKTIRRTVLIGGLAKKLSNLGEEYNRPADPSILNDLEQVFEEKDKLFRKAWQEFKESLVIPERRKVVYKTDEASLFFSEDRLLGQSLNLRFWNSVSALLVGLGILGTFVGLVWGLIPFSDPTVFTQTDGIRNAIKELLAGVSTAFVTSVWGMLASLLFNGVEKWSIGKVSQAIANLQDVLDLPFTLKTEEEIAEKQKDELEQQTAALKSFSTDLANDIKSAMADGRQELIGELHSVTAAFSNAITEQLEPTFNNLNTALEELRRQKEESSTDAVERLVEEFQKSLSGTATAQMEALAETVSKASESLITLPQQLTGMMTDVQEQVNQTRQLLSETSQDQTGQMKKMMSEMIIASQNAINTHQAGLAATTDSVNEEMNQITTNIRNLLESAANRADEQLAQRIEDMETASTQSIQALQTAITELQQAFTATASQTTEESSDMITRMRDLLESAANQAEDRLVKRTADIEAISDQSIKTLETAIIELQQALATTVDQQQQAVHNITSRTVDASTEATNQMGQLVEQSANRLEKIFQTGENSVSILLQKQGEQIEAVNAQLANSQETLTKGSEILKHIDASVTTIHQIIETTRSLSGQLMVGADRLERAGQNLTQASGDFNEQNAKYLVANQETTRQIQTALEHSKQLLNDFAQRFKTINEGLDSIFAEIEGGLNTYATTTRESINKYLSEFSDQLTQTSAALAGSVEVLTDSVEELAEMNDQFTRRRGIH